MRNCKYLCLVGGLSTSPYFQKQMKHQFGTKSKYQLSVIIPQRPILSVVEGAAYFAITQNYIKARILRYTYGELAHYPENQAKACCVSPEHIANNRYYNEYYKTWYVNNCFEVLARKNEEIYTGQIKRFTSCRSSPIHKIISLRIMGSTMEDPKTIADGKELGSVDIYFNNEDEEDMKIETEFHFYSTLIKAVIYRTKAPQDKQIRYITNFS
eukprot:UN03398